MPNYSNIKNQILQARKVWRKLTSSLHSKLSKFKRSKSLKKLKTTLGSKQPSFVHAKKMHQHVYVDELYKQPIVPPTRVELVKKPFYEENKIEKPLKKIETKGFKKGEFSSFSRNYNIRQFESSSRGARREMGEVDLRAEMFIKKFKEEMKLQRQRSCEEYHDMLARSV
ncbi:hypothetical protein LUZ60_016484 [Juncus effusus]|nr:hypothetical protein LUZ60_016484 [Juncus effusus]